MKRLKSALVALAAVAALVIASPVGAITYGQPDANKHPNVGALVGTFDWQTYPYCSGTLISPTGGVSLGHMAKVELQALR